MHFFDTDVANIRRNQAYNNNKEPDSQSDISTSKEAVMEWWFWSDRYFASTVSKHCDETMIGKYVKSRGKEYK
jgi:hypothetical protein